MLCIFVFFIVVYLFFGIFIVVYLCFPFFHYFASLFSVHVL